MRVIVKIFLSRNRLLKLSYRLKFNVELRGITQHLGGGLHHNFRKIVLLNRLKDKKYFKIEPTLTIMQIK